jgi:hypothetical protein
MQIEVGMGTMFVKTVEYDAKPEKFYSERHDFS